MTAKNGHLTIVLLALAAVALAALLALSAIQDQYAPPELARTDGGTMHETKTLAR